VTVHSRLAGTDRRPTRVVDIEFPDGDVDDRVVEALERFSLALDVLLRRTAREHDLSPLEVRLLVQLRRDGDARRRLRDLARTWGVQTAAVRNAIAGLEFKGLAEHPSDEPVVGTVRLVLTSAGRSLAQAVSAWADPMRKAISRTPASPKEALLPLLVDWVEALHRARILSVARVCLTCRFFAPDIHPDSGAPHHCQLFEKALADSELRVDCPEHQPL